MKKLIRFFFTFIIIVSFFQFALAKDDILSKVFKLKVYYLDQVHNTYVYDGYGSAVLIGKNKLITNAHVVLDESNKPLNLYEICNYQKGTQLPNCFSIAKLIRYDTEYDLALLEIVEGINVQPVGLSNLELDIGSKVRVLGFPGNGGDTITLTQGIIAGFYDEHYKIDANLDEGNSGGGGFDDEDKLIGMPVFTQKGETTMGYMIPIKIIKKFLESEKDSIKNNSGVEQKFKDYIKYIINTKKANEISNKYFKLNLKSDVFTLDYVSKDFNQNLLYYGFDSKDMKTYIGIQSIVSNQDFDVDLYAKKEKYFMEKDYKNISEKEIEFGGKKWKKIEATGDIQYSNDKEIIFLSHTKPMIKISIFDKKSGNQNLNQAIDYVKSIKFNNFDINGYEINSGYYDLPISKDFIVIKEVGYDGYPFIDIIYNDKNKLGRGNIRFEQFIENYDNSISTDSMLTSIRNQFSTNNINLTDYEATINSKGSFFYIFGGFSSDYTILYFYDFLKKSSYYFGYSLPNTELLSALSFVNKDNHTNLFQIVFSYDDGVIGEEMKDYVNDIKLYGEQSFKGEYNGSEISFSSKNEENIFLKIRRKLIEF